MEKTIYLIDGSAYLYRAFHAIRSLSTSTGIPTNATYGFTRILLKLIRERSPEYAAVFFDVKGPTFRHELYEAYKATRPPMPEDLVVQIPHIKAIVRALNIPVVEKQGFEADDLIGTYARLAREAGYASVLVTGDKDFMQLVNERTIIWDPMKDEIIDTDAIRKKFAITPPQVIDMLGLAGDASDNIPGVPGVGPKTALDLIARFGGMDGIYANIETLTAKKGLYKNLTDNRDQAFLSRKLVTIDQFAPVEHGFDTFKVTSYDAEALSALFRDLEFKKLFQEFCPKTETPKTYEAVTAIDQVKALIKTLTGQPLIAIDTETTSKHPTRAELVGISLSCRDHHAWYIPLGHTLPGKAGQPDMKKTLDLLRPLLEDAAAHKTGQNIKYDLIVLARHGVNLQGIVFDTMIASHLLNPSFRGHSLDHIAMDLLGHKTITYEEVTGKGKNQIGFQDVPLELAVDYACEDADITFLATRILAEKIRENHLESLLDTVEIPLIPVLASMEMTGIRVDTDMLASLSKAFDQEMQTLEADIHSLAGEAFNINSSQQLGAILFDKLKLPVQKKTQKKTGYSTDVDVLTTLAEHHELPARILRYRTLGKLKSTYSDALQSLVNPETGRIHTSFNQSITATGRLSSSDPNLQNIPIRTEEGQKIRQAFIPGEGAVLMSADYSQIELRILAHCADDAILIEAFNNNEDIHTRTAAEVFQVFPEFITQELRQQAKAINFGIVYGMSAFGLSRDLGITRKMAQIYIDHYFARYAGVKRFIDTTIAEARRTGMVQTLLGRQRRLEEINSSNANLRGFAERTAVNTPIQGSAADLIKLAMIRMDQQLKKRSMESRMLLSVHDEIVFEVPDKEIQALADLAREVMENVMVLKVPLKVNIGTGKNWAEAH
ncbi:MAG: DNA polymerase I [Pseudomonadota bacterium]